MPNNDLNTQLEEQALRVYSSPSVIEAQQRFNVAALSILLLGADISRLQSLQKAWEGLERETKHVVNTGTTN